MMRVSLTFALIAVLLSGLLVAQPRTTPQTSGVSSDFRDPLHRESPRSAVDSFLEVCHARNYELAWRYIDLRNAPPDQRTKDGPRLAQQLERVLDHDVEFDVASLSGNSQGEAGASAAVNQRERVASFQLSGRQVELDLDHVTLRSGLSIWLFAPDSIPLIPQLARLASASPIERRLPQPLVDWTLIDTPIWRWIVLVLMAVVLAPLSRLVSRPLILLAEWVASRVSPHVKRSTLDVFLGPLRLLLSVIAFRAGIEWVNPSSQLRLYLEHFVSLSFFVSLAWLSMAIVDITIRRLRTSLEMRHQTFSYTAMPLVSRFLKIGVLLLLIAATLSSWGYNTTTIVAGLGVGGIAIALAAQKTIENLFGGVAVITDQPVAVGDFCRFGDLVGTVEDVGLRSTRIRTLNRTVVTVPNGVFSAMTLENFAKRDKMLFHITLNLRRDALPGQVRKVLQSVTTMLKKNGKIEVGDIPVRFIGVGTYSLDLEVFAYVLTGDYDQFLRLQEDLLLQILEAVQAAGTSLAVPTQEYLATGGSQFSQPQEKGRPAA